MSASFGESSYSVESSYPGEIFFIEIDPKPPAESQTNHSGLPNTPRQKEVTSPFKPGLSINYSSKPGRLFFDDKVIGSGDHLKDFFRHIKACTPSPQSTPTSPFSPISKYSGISDNDIDINPGKVSELTKALKSPTPKGNPAQTPTEPKSESSPQSESESLSDNVSIKFPDQVLTEVEKINFSGYGQSFLNSYHSPLSADGKPGLGVSETHEKQNSQKLDNDTLFQIPSEDDNQGDDSFCSRQSIDSDDVNFFGGGFSL